MIVRVLGIVVFLAAGAADAACYADYKAKRNDPLKLHYGVIELPDSVCGDRAAARQNVAERIERGGWQLLTIEGIFGREGADARRESAGQNFLRY